MDKMAQAMGVTLLKVELSLAFALKLSCKLCKSCRLTDPF